MKLYHKAVKNLYDRGYRVNNDGEVISPFSGKKRSLYIDSKNYKSFGHRINGKRVTVFVHSLVGYQKFGEKIFEDKLEIRHLDNDSLNNSPNNIDIGTHSVNMLDRNNEDRIINSSNRTYDYIKVREYYEHCRSYKDTMEEFNIPSKGVLHYILNKKIEILEKHYN